MSSTGQMVGIVAPALGAGILVTAALAPLGMQVLARGIVFIDLAIAQIAGLGVLAADWMGFQVEGLAVQISALIAALLGALFLTWTERRWADVQEAIIGVVFVVAACAGILVLAGNPHGGEHLQDLLAGQILWVNPARLPLQALIYALIIGAWFGLRDRMGRIGFYVLFACAVTVSVQLVGVYLVFASLIVPALATRNATHNRLLKAYTVGIGGYALGLFVSVATDLPTGPIIVWTIVGLGILVACLQPRLLRDAAPHATTPSPDR